MIWLPNQTIDRLDVDEIANGLWQGSEPPRGKILRSAGFRYLVLAAMEIQPSARDFPGMKVLKAPLDDVPRKLRREEARIVYGAALWVAQRMENGPVLVTCAAGLNRSGLVTAMTLILRGERPRNAVALVKLARPWALGNKYFVEHLLSIEGCN